MSKRDIWVVATELQYLSMALEFEVEGGAQRRCHAGVIMNIIVKMSLQTNEYYPGINVFNSE